MLRQTQTKSTTLWVVSGVLLVRLSETLPVSPIETLASVSASIHNGLLAHPSMRAIAQSKRE